MPPVVCEASHSFVLMHMGNNKVHRIVGSLIV